MTTQLNIGRLKASYTTLISLALMFVVGMPVQSLAISYEVNRMIGAGGVTGFIETNGFIGILTPSHIVNWNLLLNNGTTTHLITGPPSASNFVIITGSALTATPEALFFDFSAKLPGGFFKLNNDSSENPAWLMLTEVGSLPEPQEQVIFNTIFQNAFHSGKQTIGTNNTIPEPSTFLLLATGLGGLAAWRYRKSMKP